MSSRATAQLAGVTPQFPYGPAYAAPLGGTPGGNTVEWLGADNGSMAIFPDGQTTFWAFGDSFLGPLGATNRSLLAAKIVNTIAIGRVQTNPATGAKQFLARYYYRGNFAYDLSSPILTLNNPSAFFIDPDAFSDAPNNTPNNPPDRRYSPNHGVDQTTPLNEEQCSRFFVGKAIFIGPTLFVFLNRVDGAAQSRPLGSTVARINNACNPDGSATDPRTWQVDYLKLSNAPNPFIGAEAIIVNMNDMLVYASFTMPPNVSNVTVALKIPLSVLQNAPARSNIASAVQYLDKTQSWVSTGSADNPVGPVSACHDVGIPCGGGFTVRPLIGNKIWRNLFIDNVHDPRYVRIQDSPSPLGPWGDPQRIFRFPELDPFNRPFAPDVKVNAFNPGIYCKAMDEAKLALTAKCYQAFEIPAFSTDPDHLVALTYASDRGSTINLSIPPTDPAFATFFPEGCRPGQDGFWLWDNNFYRVKGVSGLVPVPLDKR